MVELEKPVDPLTPPEPVGEVSGPEAEAMLPLGARPKADTLARIDARVEALVEALTEADVHSDEFESRINAIHALGTREIREAANVSNRLLNRPVRGLSDDSEVGAALLALRRTVEALDPSERESAGRKLLGIIPLSTRATDYFRKYESAQSHIDAVLNSLHHSQDELQRDIAAIEQEKANLWEIMGRLQELIHACRQLDSALEQRLSEIAIDNPEKARVVREEVLFYVRQKEQDLLTQLAVSVQGYLALDVIRKNDLELIKGVERATTTTISALRTAVIVAQALANQKLVLDQISALNDTTSNLIASTSALLKDQSTQTYRQSTGATVGMEQLQTAFDNVFETLDSISAYKQAALETMSQTINQLSVQVQRATTYLDRVRGEQALDSTGDLLALEETESPE